MRVKSVEAAHEELLLAAFMRREERGEEGGGTTVLLVRRVLRGHVTRRQRGLTACFSIRERLELKTIVQSILKASNTIREQGLTT